MYLTKWIVYNKLKYLAITQIQKLYILYDTINKSKNNKLVSLSGKKKTALQKLYRIPWHYIINIKNKNKNLIY